jgi:hypothetical protein
MLIPVTPGEARTVDGEPGTVVHHVAAAFPVEEVCGILVPAGGVVKGDRGRCQASLEMSPMASNAS